MEDFTFPLKVGNLFEIRISDGSIFSKRWKDTPIYQIVNLSSKMVEGEAFSLARAMLQARAGEMSIERLLEDISDLEMVAMENMFDELEKSNDPDLKPH